MDEIVLENQWIRLEPLGFEHVEGLLNASDESVWEFMPVHLKTAEDFHGFVTSARSNQRSGTGLAFAVIEKQSGNIVGSSGFLNAVAEHKRVEIGFTWYQTQWRRSFVNTACKLLLMSHAFESLEMNRVEFKTDSLNSASRNALARLGATEEGTLYYHMVQPDGRLRNSVYFSVLFDQWPKIKEWLQQRLNQ